MRRKTQYSLLTASDKGSVMMEYLILNLGFFVVLAMAAHFCLPDFNARPVYTLEDNGSLTFVQTGVASGYGRLGNAFLAHYRMVLDIVSMPYP